MVDRKWRNNVLLGGVDEVGRSSLVGPIVAAAVVYKSTDPKPDRIGDSKKIKGKYGTKGIEKWYNRIIKECVCWAVASISNEEVDAVGVHNASLLCMAKAVASLEEKPDFIWVDGKYPIPFESFGHHILQVSKAKADSTIWYVSAASIVAKYTRDSLLCDWHHTLPELRPYHIDTNAGYGTPEHLQALSEYGPSIYHRKRFKQVQQACCRE